MAIFHFGNKYLNIATSSTSHTSIIIGPSVVPVVFVVFALKDKLFKRNPEKEYASISQSWFINGLYGTCFIISSNICLVLQLWSSHVSLFPPWSKFEGLFVIPLDRIGASIQFYPLA